MIPSDKINLYFLKVEFVIYFDIVLGKINNMYGSDRMSLSSVSNSNMLDLISDLLKLKFAVELG